MLRNYPISAHLRFLLEEIRPEMRHYFFESEKDGMPFSRDKRAVIYQRAKMALDKRPFGTQYDVYSDGYEWLRHSIAPKPVGFKLCVGHPWEFLAICKAILATGICPDFVVVDGTEGGTGAAPLEFMDHLGMPMREGLNFVHNALVGIGVRERVRIGASGKIANAFDIARAIALGADWCNAACAFMFSLGCIQSLSCHTDRCPTGVATQDLTRSRALVVPDKLERVYNFHRSTLHTLAELTAAAGLDHCDEFRPVHFCRRVSAREVLTLADLYPALRPGELLDGTSDPRFRDAWTMARAESFYVNV